MQYRGPILVVFAMSLVLSPIAILAVQKAQEQSATPGEVRTIGQSQEDCASRTIQTRTLTIGCGARAQNTAARRITTGGAMFVTARN